MDNPQLEIGLADQSGFEMVYVNTVKPPMYQELRWADPTMAPTLPRRVLRLPLFIKALTPWKATPKLSRFMAAPGYPGMPVFDDLFYLAVGDASGNILREASISPIFLTLLKNGEINLAAGETAYCWARMALWDLGAILNVPLSYATLTLDSANQYPGVFASRFFGWTIGPMEVKEFEGGTGG